ncbi:MAG: membrane protein insertion efficiency factor YidD [Oscillospiraceae bacterium]|jgi:putative membrane protein insertion efficiency factor|nr:membrane protein insertion efficiency factor YidD [Oscillospiraceae bacterium]
MIFGYKRWISPAMGARCRFYPSCSSYAAEAIERFGSVKGLWFTARRILRCNQFTRGGIDEVPRKK